MKMNKKGFTLIEMLVVIAIIAVLVSIVIPVVGSATEKAKEAADAANIRAAIAEITTKALMDGGNPTATVDMTQGTPNFVTEDLKSIGGLSDADFAVVAGATKGQTVTLTWTDGSTAADGTVTEAHVAATVGTTPTNP